MSPTRKARILFGRGEAAEARGRYDCGGRSLCRGGQDLPARFDGAGRFPFDRFGCVAADTCRLASRQRNPLGRGVTPPVSHPTSTAPPVLRTAHGGTSQSNRAAPLSSMQVPSTGSAVAAPTASTGSGLTFATGNLSSPPVQKDWSGVGVYELEGAIDFNVLDWVFFDPPPNSSSSSDVAIHASPDEGSLISITWPPCSIIRGRR